MSTISSVFASIKYILSLLYINDVTAVSVVVIMCGGSEFIQQFIFAAHDMGMTDPEEYVYLLVAYNAVEIVPPWRGQKGHSNPQNAFWPVYQVRLVQHSDV